MNMYFSDPLDSEIYVDMIFTKALNFSTFDMTTFQNITIDSALYTMSMFNISYVQLSKNSYRIIIAPVGYIFLQNVTFIV